MNSNNNKNFINLGLFTVKQIFRLEFTSVHSTLVQCCYGFVFCTLLVTSSTSLATATHPAPSTSATQQEADTRQEDVNKLESTTLSPPPPAQKEAEPPDVHKFANHISPRLSLLMDWAQFQADRILDYTLGFNYGFQRKSHEQLEFGVMLISRRLGGRLTLRKKNYFTGSAEKAFRPFYAYGVGVFARPEDNLFFATRLTNYTALATLGFEESIAERMSWTVELEIGAGFQYRTLQVVIGYLWAW